MRSMDFPLYDGFTDSFKQRLQTDPALAIDYYHENLDVLNCGIDKNATLAIAAGLRQKYRTIRPDIVVAHSLAAAKFLQNYCGDIFGGTPVVAFAFRPVDIDPALSRDNYTFCYPAVEPARNVELILALRPAVRQLYVVIGRSEFEANFRRELEQQLAPFAARLSITYLDDMLPDILAQLRTADEQTAVLFVSFIKDAGGNILVPVNVVRTIAASSPVPVFASNAAHVDAGGAVGGYVLNMQSVGREVGAKTLAILRGKADRGTVATLAISEYRFEWGELQRWQIDEALLPLGSVVVNKPVSVWQLYGGYITAALVFGVIQAALIARYRRRGLLAESKAALGADLIATQQDIIRDRTEELYESEDRFQQIFRHSPAMIAIQSMTDGSYVEVNQKFLAILEYSREEVIGRTPAALALRVDPDGPEADALQDALRQDGELSLREYKLRTKSGRIVTVLATATLTRLGADQCRIAILQDITREKILEADLLRLDRLNLVGEMAAGIGHEVRNPMTTVRGYLQMFRRKAKFSGHYSQLDTMIEELDRANAIISEFLSLAKNKLADLRPGDLNAALAAILPLIKADALRMGCTLELKTGPIPVIRFDEKELRQLVLNLARNALEATPAGGRVTIATRRGGDKAILVVQDTGHGIPPVVVEKIGTPFLTTKENGTGLGLSVCYRIAQRHGAAIEFATGENGTTFRIAFPPATLPDCR